MKTNTKEFKADKEKYSITDIVITVEDYFGFSASTKQIGNMRKFLQRKCNQFHIQNVGSDGKKLIDKKDVEWLINEGCYEEFVQYTRKAHKKSKTEKELKELYTHIDRLKQVQKMWENFDWDECYDAEKKYSTEKYIFELGESAVNHETNLLLKGQIPEHKIPKEHQEILDNITEEEKHKLIKLYEQIEYKHAEYERDRVIKESFEEYKQQIINNAVCKYLVKIDEDLLYQDIYEDHSFHDMINDYAGARRLYRMENLETYCTNILDEIIKDKVNKYFNERMETFLKGEQFIKAIEAAAKKAVDEH